MIEARQIGSRQRQPHDGRDVAEFDTAWLDGLMPAINATNQALDRAYQVAANQLVLENE